MLKVTMRHGGGAEVAVRASCQRLRSCATLSTSLVANKFRKFVELFGVSGVTVLQQSYRGVSFKKRNSDALGSVAAGATGDHGRPRRMEQLRTLFDPRLQIRLLEVSTSDALRLANVLQLFVEHS